MRFWVWAWWKGAKPIGRRVLYAFVLSAIASCCYGAGSDPRIEVRGNRRIDAQAIREHFRAAPDALSAPSAINAALKELYATGLFEDVKIVPSGARLIVTVVEAPLIDRLRFEGNKQLKEKDLAREIGSKPGGPMTKASVREDAIRITEVYRRNGRYQVEVAPKTIARGNRVDLVFEI